MAKKMKNKIAITLSVTCLFVFAGCFDSSMSISSKKKVKAVSFTSPAGVESELKLDDGNGRITSGFNGKNTHQEVRELSVEVTSSTYIIRSENKTYYIPTSYMLEVLD